MEKLNGLNFIRADLWVFDNDGTLYSNPNDLDLAVGELMIQYVSSYYCVNFEEAREKRKQLLQKHNTRYTLIALKNEGINEDDFIQKSYLSIKPENYGIRHSQKLKYLIGSLDGEKIILTNNPSEFANLILESLGVKHLFSQVIGMREMGYIQKPHLEAYNILKSSFDLGKKVVFIDDEFENIISAKEAGCCTVYIGANDAKESDIGDYSMVSLV